MIKHLLISILVTCIASHTNIWNNRLQGDSVCAEHYTGGNCDVYKPNRHCADLKQFHGIDKSGYYNISWIEKGYVTEVYCDMDTEGGGWTLMSSAEGAEFAFVTYAQYQKPFGGKGKSVTWLGLDNIAAMTQARETSLRVDLHRCAFKAKGKGKMPLHAMDIHESFRVNSKEKGYSVYTPMFTSGNDTLLRDGWVKWGQYDEGPEFSTFDHDPYGCSKTMGNTGFWFYHTNSSCYFANLNGVRGECNQATRYDPSVLSYDTEQMKQASMWLRPRQFPQDPEAACQEALPITKITKR